MASIQSDFSNENRGKPDIDTVNSLVAIINHHMRDILENADSRKALKTKCTSQLEIHHSHSVLSNLYWGIELAEAAFLPQSPESKSIGLESSETMLQIPASLDETGFTMGISNEYLVCCAYFYLSAVEFLRGNEWQTAKHFLEAVSVGPRIVYAEFAPGVMWQRILSPLFVRDRVETMTSLGGGFDDAMRWMAGRYKPWLVYYQIVSTGNLPKTTRSLRDILTESEPDSPTTSQHSRGEEGVLKLLLEPLAHEDFQTTMRWLVKKTGLTSAHHKNMIKDYDFFDQCLMDSGIDLWCSKVAQRILVGGSRVFHELNEGLQSESKRVSRDCLTAAAWLGCELAKGPDEVRDAACEIMMQSIEKYMHPRSELEERLLACLCIYNYTSGKGMKKLIGLSDGVRESLRRLSNVTWMAEELLRVADYFHPNTWVRISCVHSQILEAGNEKNGAVTALIYYKGQLHGGYADGSIKVWDIRGKSVKLVQELKEHEKAVTCFALYEPGNCLLSSSSDKTIKMWRMIERSLECVEVIHTKESITSVDSWGGLIFATTKSCKLNNREKEIKAACTRWMHNEPISSIAVFKDYLYCASSVFVEGSKMKGWRRGDEAQVSIETEKGERVVAMEVVEDFIYLNCSASMSSLQIWLRSGTQKKVGRVSAGSKITSILSANDMLLCGTEKGLIKGWIPI